MDLIIKNILEKHGFFYNSYEDIYELKIKNGYIGVDILGKENYSIHISYNENYKNLTPETLDLKLIEIIEIIKKI